MAKKKIPDQCGNCFFAKGSTASSYGIRIIACRRHPPKQGDRQDRPGMYPLPMLNENEWCGEWKSERKTDGKEEK